MSQIIGISVLALIFFSGFFATVRMLLDSIKKLKRKDLRFAIFRKKIITGTVKVIQNTRKKGHRHHFFHIELQGQEKTTPYFSVNDLAFKIDFYNPMELYSIIEPFEKNSLLEISFVKKGYFSPKPLLVSVDGIPLTGKRSKWFDWLEPAFFLVLNLAMLFMTIICIYLIFFEPFRHIDSF